jgi:hypothetical protein
MRRYKLLFLSVLLFAPHTAIAQEPPAEPPPEPVPNVQVVPVPVPYSPAPDPNPDAHLPSSSQSSTDTSRSSDGFDLRPPPGSGVSYKGSEEGAYVVSGQYVPDLHTAKRGDTLWDLSKRYYNNPYNWPRIWSYNRQIQNPHWIYPGDHIRLKGGYGVRMVGGFVRPQAIVPPNTVFQRHVGYVLDGRHPVWGEVIGSPEDQMLLSENDEIYIKLDENKEKEVENGTFLTIFEPRKVKSLSPYAFVWIRGVAKVNRINKKTRMARAKIVESTDVIERGVKVGPIDRKIDIVKPVRNKKTVEAQIVGALYPFEFYGQGQVVFIDKGDRDGVEVGNRFFAVSRGDEWRLALRNAGELADERAITEDDRMARTEETPDKDEPKLYPAETYAEVIVLRVREQTATCLVTASIREIARGSILVARKGY